MYKYSEIGLRLILVSLLLHPSIIWAFPPYKSTDADTADPYHFEIRIGLVQVEHDEGKTEYITPLARANFGFPGNFEILSEFEYHPDENEIGDGALGIKWAPVQGAINFGIETLALLPVNAGQHDIGVETQVLATIHGNHHGLQLHMNAGGFHDPRGPITENGWRGSMLIELHNISFRPGFELFAKKTDGHDTDLRLGTGIIKSIGRFEIRSAIHIGVTNQAPDVVFNFWFSTKIPL
jgi:hypothetical protein